ncbi:methylmalonyl Co-A mutase-associated GTPase MeaB [Halalkalicoccus jeotgali]|uniref:ArgK-type transport ATPase n=1 Tax=Halalkalicoccus jeotgali (strain DSM 18796 / CECT 7217 / JCM 14584 / KCTC 4019 / B3) TaxID=795797 RepID=D8J5I8_HALJB|nr:methylmalonyl Co-A mutase-associated GTPase MeaB [Halalkalicoccus jeotgali]ADJ15684.1 argK-type transport ATPase [Halalkalicoccus jeotgali B3]ELY36546.1 argK-type transport ATPase [Halalkalicoccus jeotgali B3]
MSGGDTDLVGDLLDGRYRALARAITRIENRSPGYRDLVAALHEHTGDAEVIGITGSPGAGKSTLVDKLAKAYRDEGLTVGVIAVDPSSPYTGGAVLGDRIRMASTTGDMDTFVRSMSARGQLGGLSTATGDAITAFDAFGIDRIIVETVGAGQNEVDIVRTADTVAVLVQPESGDDIQMLKAGILEIGDVFVVNKADMPGADRTVKQLSEMLEGRDNGEWTPEIVETVATSGEGLDALVETFADHRTYLESSGTLEAKARTRYAEEVRTLLREDAGRLLEGEIERRGGIEELVDRIVARETDPYTVADEIIEPLAECLAREEAEPSPR